jgi:hypothetical protein
MTMRAINAGDPHCGNEGVVAFPMAVRCIIRRRMTTVASTIQPNKIGLEARLSQDDTLFHSHAAVLACHAARHRCR